MPAVVLPLLNMPNIEFFHFIKSNPEMALLEKFENFPKQTLRNRAQIYSPNGLLDLSIPVNKGSRLHTLYKDITISYDFNWQRIHWQTLETCYRSSAYFEFYEDDFAPFYEKKTKFLFDFNTEILQLLIKKLKLNTAIQFTEEYTASSEFQQDFRSHFSPKNTAKFAAKKYYQVFEDRHGFIPNLSVIDLLFNHGPQANTYL